MVEEANASLEQMEKNQQELREILTGDIGALKANGPNDTSDYEVVSSKWGS